ncbi:MAG: hypothetical protein ACOYK8_09785 [Alphaproteobacteria bacterium]
MEYHEFAKVVQQRIDETLKKLPYSYMADYAMDGVSPRTHMSHFLDPEHLGCVHIFTLLGVKLGKVIEFDDKTDPPSITFEIYSGKNLSVAKLSLLSPFDVAMEVTQPYVNTSIIFSVDPVSSHDSVIKVHLFSDKKLAQLLFPLVSGITVWEDLSYLKQTESRITEIFNGPVTEHRQLFELYKNLYDQSIDEWVAQATAPAPRRYQQYHRKM